MTIELFITLLILSLSFIIGGKYIEAPVAQIAGTGILFVAGLFLMFSSVSYVSGELSNSVYDYEEGVLITASTTTSNVYSSWDEEELLGIKTRHTIAVVLLTSAILTFISVLSHLRGGFSNEQ